MNPEVAVSIVIPCRNENSFIKECIDAILHSEGVNFSLINIYIVDGMSNDGTRETIANIIAHHPNVHLVDNPKQLTPYAFNLGIEASGKVDFVQIIGARHIVSKNYISLCIKRLTENAEIWCVGGKIINEYANETGKIISKAMSTSFGMGLGNFRTLEKSGFTDTVTSPMYPYWVFEKTGLFDEELVRNQDDDFNFRVTNAGGKIYFENEISLKYYVRASFKGLWRQFFQYGYWKVYVNKKHKAITTIRQLIPPFFVLYLILMICTSAVSSSLFLLSTIPLLCYLVLAKFVSIKLLESFQLSTYLKTLITFPILHISYGLGYLTGIFEFILLQKKPSEKQKRLSR